MMPKRDNERDLELDKKIEALRRKNEVLMKRYKEVEEDRKMAEEEGMALQSRKGKADDLTITISKSTDVCILYSSYFPDCFYFKLLWDRYFFDWMQESRVVVTKPFGSGSPTGTGQQEGGADRVGEGSSQGAGRGTRKQLTVTMAGKKLQHFVEQATLFFLLFVPKVIIMHPTGKSGEPENPQASTDLNIPTSREEQEEYLRWKKEREQIDKERVARHKNAKGQWRRAWDMDKTENMFSDKSLSDRDWGTSTRGGRNARRGQQKGYDKRGKDKAAKNVLVMSSKAKGKDRLTGRARRWQDNDGENPQTTDTTLEEFLEELDALTDANGGNLKDLNSKAKPDPSSVPESQNMCDSDSLKEDTVTQMKAETSSPRGLEKKVRFSEELFQRAPAKQTTTPLQSATPESKGPLKASSTKYNEVQRSQLPCVSAEQDDSSSQDKGGGPPAPPVTQQQASNTEHFKKDTSSPAVSSSTPAEKNRMSPHESPVHLVEVSKCNSSGTNTGIDDRINQHHNVLAKYS
ncbi:hypothetical protein XENOCAPTIV_013809 [Xenoophorus captivus]|uniref:Coiled-coil domain containing 9B n=1 Tax=Xenoophorus captivus TaxID=1517983 RepID=A0ABV0SAE1_9TELE